jgi:hypothetical protein
VNFFENSPLFDNLHIQMHIIPAPVNPYNIKVFGLTPSKGALMMGMKESGYTKAGAGGERGR